MARFRGRAERVRQAGVRQAYMMRWFFLTVSLISAVGTVVVFWGGGLLVLRGAGFTIGTMVAFTAYLGMLYGPLSALTNARMDLATSLVSFERVFEVIDLPLEIAERPDAKTLTTVRGDVRFDRVSFSYEPDDGAEEAAAAGLAEVVRFGGPRSPAMTAPPLSQEGGKLKTDRGEARTGPPPLKLPPTAAGPSATSASRSSRASWPPSSARAGPARRPSPTCCRGSTTRRKARSASTATTSAISP